jgi:hypothetical protein
MWVLIDVVVLLAAFWWPWGAMFVVACVIIFGVAKFLEG